MGRSYDPEPTSTGSVNEVRVIFDFEPPSFVDKQVQWNRGRIGRLLEKLLTSNRSVLQPTTHVCSTNPRFLK